MNKRKARTRIAWDSVAEGSFLKTSGTLPYRTNRIHFLCAAIVAVALVVQLGAGAIFAEAPANTNADSLSQIQSGNTLLAYADERPGQDSASVPYELTAEDKELLADLAGRKIKLGWFTSLSYYENERGNEAGALMPVTDLLRSWGLTVDPVRVEKAWDYTAGGDDEVDLYFAMTLTRDLVDTYACSGGIFETDILSITQKDATIEDIASITGKSIGVMSEPGIQEALAPYLTEGEEVEVYSNIEDLLSDLEQGRIDVVCTSMTMQADIAGHSDLSYKVMKGVAPFVKGMVAPSEDLRPLISLIDRVLASGTGKQLREDTEQAIDASLITQLHMKLGNQIYVLQGAYDSIKVLCSENLYPFCFLQNGNFEGILPGTMKIFTNVTGIPVEYVPISTFEDEGAIDKAIEQGEIQVIAGVYKDLSPTLESNYSIPLYKDSIMMFKLADRDYGNRSVADLSVGVASDLFPYVSWQKYFGDVPRPYLSEKDALEALRKGEVELALVSSMCISYGSLIEEDFSFDRFDSTEIVADLRLNYNMDNFVELNNAIDEAAALYNSSYAYQTADWKKEVLDYQQEYIRAESDRQLMSLTFGLALLILVVLLVIAALLFYRQFRKYSDYDKQIRMLISNQDEMDIGFGDLKHGTFSSKGDWSILRKLGIDLPHVETLTFDEVYAQSGLDVRSMHQAMIGDMKAKGETARTREILLEYKGKKIVLSQSVYLLSDTKFDFYAIDVTSSREEAASLKELAEHDHLTHAYRRKAFIDRAAELREDESGSLYLAIVDIDFFKKVNDSYGHEIGDRVICMVVDKMMEHFDSAGFVGRWGGEEFVAVYPAVSDEAAFGMLEAYLTAVEHEAVTLDEKAGRTINVTVSGGLTEWRKKDDLSFAISEADAALYTSKKNGRNRATFFEGGVERRCRPN